MNAVAEITKAEIVNGINVADLKGLITGVEDNPANGATKWRVATSWQGQTRSRARIDGFAIGGEDVNRSFSFDIDEPLELGGGNAFANPQEHLIAALNACMIVGFAAQCALRGIKLERLEITTEGDIDLRGFLGLDPAVPAGYESLRQTVFIKGNATPAQFAEVHDAVMATSPNVYNIANAVALNPSLVVE